MVYYEFQVCNSINIINVICTYVLMLKSSNVSAKSKLERGPQTSQHSLSLMRPVINKEISSFDNSISQISGNPLVSFPCAKDLEV